MPINLTYAKPTSLYAGSPVEEVKALNEEASKQYNQARKAKDAIDIYANNVQLEDKNFAIKQRVINNIKTKFDDLVKNGNYQDANYLVGEVGKELLMDNEFQDAIKSNENKQAYHANLKAKLDKGLAGEKGGITEARYNYAITKSELANQQPLKYHPDKMKSENMFQGINISDDLSQEIADQTFDRIKDWKASGSTTVDGKTYTIQNIGGVEKVMLGTKEVSYSEVANALKQDILNNDAYKRYLDENREIDKFNKTFDYQTKSQRPLDRNKDLDMFDDKELKEMYLGISEKDIEELKKSTNLADKAALEEIKNKEQNFNLEDPKIVEQLYDNYTTKDQLNKVVYPAAEKASFKDFEQKIFTDHAALENLKHAHDKALKKYEKKLSDENLPPIMQSMSQANQFTGDDFAKKQENIKSLQDQAQKALTLMNKTEPNSPLWRTRRDDYNSALGQLNIANSEVKNFYAGITPETKQKIQDNVSNMFNIISGRTNRDNKISQIGLEDLINEAKVNKDIKTQSELLTAKMYLQQGKELPPEFVKGLTNTLTNNENYLKILSDEDERIAQRNAIIPDNESGFTNNPEGEGIITGVVGGVNNFLKTVAGAVTPYYTSKTTINNIVTEAYNEKSLDQTMKLTSIPSMEGVEDKKYIPELTKQFYGYAKNVLANSSDLYTTDGTPLDAVLAGKSDKKFYKMDEKGKYVETLPDLDKTAVAIASGAKDGLKRISTTYYDKQGVPLVLSNGTPDSDKGARSSVIIASKDPETFTPLYNIVAQYSNKSGNTDDALSLQGEVNFGHILNKARLGNNVDPFEVSFPNGNSRVIGYKKEADDASTIIDMTQTINGLPNANYGKPLFGDKYSTFRSNEELVKAFQKSME